MEVIGIAILIIVSLVAVRLNSEKEGSGDSFIESLGQTVTLLFFGGVVLIILYLFIFS